jgi:S1-C subfamily serine protease
VEYGLLVYQLVPGGSAQAAGLRSTASDGSIGDIILAAEGTKFGDLDDLYRMLDKKKIGDTVNFEIYREGRTITVPVRLLATPTTTRRAVQE